VRVLFFIFIFICWLPVQAQPTLNPINMALGNGGSAYLTGPEANFYNPANLLFHDKVRNTVFSFGNAAGYIEPVINFTNVNEQYDNFRNTFLPFSEFERLNSSSERIDLVNRLFKDSRSKTDHISRFELNWFGISWKGKNQSFSIAARTRGANRFDIGRGWYDTVPQEENEQLVVNRLLRQQTQIYHELSFGYAESFDFLNNITPRLDQFSIGIAPKFVVSGAHYDATFDSKLLTDNQPGQINQIQTLNHTSAGDYSDLITSFLTTRNTDASVTANIDTKSLFKPTGFGAGLDFGVTYLLTFGDDLSMLSDSGSPVNKSLRLSFSISDVGLVFVNKNPLELNVNTDTTLVNATPDAVTDIFQGSQGEFIGFINQQTDGTVFDNPQQSSKNLTILLPTALHTGILLELERIKLSGDLNLGLKRNAFHTTTLFAHLGLEILPFKLLPIRAGTRFGAKSPTLFGLGTGLETNRFDFSVAVQFSGREFWQKTPVAGSAVSAMRFYF